MHKSTQVIGVVALSATVFIGGIAYGATFKQTRTNTTRVRVVTTYLPTRHLTPGWVNPFVKQNTLDTTVCISGYSHSIRPPISYTSYLKKEQIKYYGLGGTKASYEEDHFIPLSLGGSPFDSRNLWPEPIAAAKDSDFVEVDLWHKLCNGEMTLKLARATIIKWKLTHG